METFIEVFNEIYGEVKCLCSIQKLRLKALIQNREHKNVTHNSLKSKLANI